MSTPQNEIFKLDDGSEVGTGLALPTAEELAEHETSAKVFGGNDLLDMKDCEKLLKGDRYKQLREQRKWRLMNQARLNACAAFSAVGCMHQAIETSGQPLTPLAACHLYMDINGGVDQGAQLVHAKQRIEKKGVSPRELNVDGKKVRFPTNVWRRNQVSPSVLSVADREAENFIGFELQIIPKDWASFVPAVCSAIARDLPIQNAWHVVGASMNGLNNGYIRQGRGPGNHATYAQSGKWVGGKTGVHPDITNSWKATNDLFGPVGGGWGDLGGFGLMTMEEFYQCRQYHVFWVMVAIRLNPKFDPLLN